MTTTATKIFADRIGRIEVSATMAITAAALKLKSEGVNLADFGAGEPHFSTPRHIKDAAIEAIEKNFTRYTNVAGIPEVRKAVVDRHQPGEGRRKNHRSHAQEPRTRNRDPGSALAVVAQAALAGRRRLGLARGLAQQGTGGTRGRAFCP